VRPEAARESGRTPGKGVGARALAGAVLVLAAAGGCGGAPAAASERTFVYAGGGSTIDVFEVDPATGALVLRGMAAAGDNAYVADLDVRRRRLYVQTQFGIPVAIRGFDIGAGDGLLQPSGDHPLPYPLVSGVTQLLVHPSAPWLLISATGEASGLQDQLFPIAADGQIGAPRVISTQYYGFSWYDDGRTFFGLDGVAIGQFTFDPAAGALTPRDPLEAEGSRDHQMLALASHPNGRWVYSVEESRLGRFTLDAAAGTLAGQGYDGNPLPADAIYWTSAVVHAGGGFLYVVGYLRETLLGFIDQFAIDARSGALAFVRRELGDARHRLRLGSLQAPLLLGERLIIGGQSADGVSRPVLAVYRIDRGDGTLGAEGEPIELRPADSTVVNFILAARLPR
jgi:hypothetical protein